MGIRASYEWSPHIQAAFIQQASRSRTVASGAGPPRVLRGGPSGGVQHKPLPLAPVCFSCNWQQARKTGAGGRLMRAVHVRSVPIPMVLSMLLRVHSSWGFSSLCMMYSGVPGTRIYVRTWHLNSWNMSWKIWNTFLRFSSLFEPFRARLLYTPEYNSFDIHIILTSYSYRIINTYIRYILSLVFTRKSTLYYFTGGHINQDPPYTQKPIYYTFFAHHIWSLLLCSPVNTAAIWDWVSYFFPFHSL